VIGHEMALESDPRPFAEIDTLHRSDFTRTARMRERAGKDARKTARSR
jgi:hypothetical protein